MGRGRDRGAAVHLWRGIAEIVARSGVLRAGDRRERHAGLPRDRAAGQEPGEETGLLVPPGDVAALSQAIAALARDPERRRAMGRAGRLLVERDFAEERIAAQTLGLYESALYESGRHERTPGERGTGR